jgi:hypothetical protein
MTFTFDVKFYILYVVQGQTFLWFCPSLILFKGYMLKYMKCQNIWIPTLVNFLEDSSTHFIFGKSTKPLYSYETRKRIAVTWNNAGLYNSYQPPLALASKETVFTRQ